MSVIYGDSEFEIGRDGAFKETFIGTGISQCGTLKIESGKFYFKMESQKKFRTAEVEPWFVSRLLEHLSK